MKTKLLFTAAFAALFFVACSNEDNSSSEPLNNHTKSSSSDNSGIAALQDEALASKTQQFVFEGNGEGAAVFETESGVLIRINLATLKINGDPVAGAFKLDYVEIFNRSSMVTTNMTTMGVADEQTDDIQGLDLWQLTSGGEFFVNITTFDGQQLDNGAEVTLTVPTALTGGDDPQMTAWDGKENKEGNVIWDQEEDAKPILDREGQGYELDLDNFGWSNIDRFWNYNGPKTTIQVDVPAGYDNTNCMVYLATEGEQNILAPLDTYDPGTELFGEHYGQVPVGLNGYIIFVSEGSGGQWEYAIKPVTFAPNDIINIGMGDIMTGSQADVENAIDAIP